MSSNDPIYCDICTDDTFFYNEANNIIINTEGFLEDGIGLVRVFVYFDTVLFIPNKIKIVKVVFNGEAGDSLVLYGKEIEFLCDEEEAFLQLVEARFKVLFRGKMFYRKIINDNVKFDYDYFLEAGHTFPVRFINDRK